MPITWYLSSPTAIPDGITRYGWYGGPGTPAANFDGWEQSVGGFASGSMFGTYNPIVSSHLATSSPLIMDATFTLTGLDGTVGVTIEVDETVTTTNNTVYFAVVEDIQGTHSVNLARMTLAEEPFTLTTPGESVYLTRDFTLSSTWAVENIGVVIFVQSSNGTRPVLQSCSAVADYAGTIHVDADPDGLDAGWHMEGPFGFVQDRTNDAEMTVFAAGEYTITWQPVEGWTSPPVLVETLILEEDGEIFFDAVYTDGPFTGRTDGVLGNAGTADQSVALRDFDGDGDLDIAVGSLGAPDLLMINGAGSFTASTQPMLAGNDSTVHLAWGDMDNDGHPDLYSARQGEANVLLRNDGAGGFTDATFGGLGDAGPASGASWVDFNRDGKLDLYLVNTDAADALLTNLGENAGTYYFFPHGWGPESAGKSAVWGDYDDDGDQDYYLLNSYEANELYEFDGNNTFWEANIPVLLEDVGGGAGAAWGDYDNDGDLDLYFTNYGSTDRLIRQTSSGWSLVDGGPLGDEGFGRGVAWGDLDNDGDLDLFLARHGQYDRFLRNDGGGTFVNVPLGIDASAGHANGCALGDMDGDGDLDIYVVNDGDPNVLLVNGMGDGNHWLHLDLVGDDCNRDAVGARVNLYAGGQTQIREVNGGTGYRSQNSPTVEFGLGATAAVDSVVVRWPCGTEESWTTLAVDQRHTLVENGSTTDAPPAAVASLRLHPARPNPFNPRTEVRFELPAAGRAVLEVYDLAGRRVRTLIDGDLPAGPHTAVWSGDDDEGRPAATGTYLMRLRHAGAMEVQRATLVK